MHYARGVQLIPIVVLDRIGATYSIAPDDGRLWLLPSGSDQVHGPPAHRARPSTDGGERGV